MSEMDELRDHLTVKITKRLSDLERRLAALEPKPDTPAEPPPEWVELSRRLRVLIEGVGVKERDISKRLQEMESRLAALEPKPDTPEPTAASRAFANSSFGHKGWPSFRAGFNAGVKAAAEFARAATCHILANQMEYGLTGPAGKEER